MSKRLRLFLCRDLPAVLIIACTCYFAVERIAKRNMRAPFATVVVHVGGNLQAAITAANLGDTIVLDRQSAGSYTAPFTLPVKVGCNGSAYVTIESEDIALLPAGTRVSASDNAKMAKIVTTSGSGVGAFIADSGAGCYRLRGLEITNNTAVAISSMTDLRSGSYYIFDRNYQHPQECPNTVAPYHTTARFGVTVTGSHDVQITNSSFPCYYGLPPGGTIGQTASDTNIIAIEAGPSSDILIDNNYMEPFFNGIFVGGADSPPTASGQGTIQGSSPTPSVTTARLSSVTGLAIGDVIAIQIPYDPSMCKVANPLTNCYGNGIVSNIVGNVVTYSALIGTDQGSANRITIPGGTVPSGIAIWRNEEINDVTISRNNIYLYEPFCQQQYTFNNNNHPKGYMEIKDVIGLLVDGNYMHGWPAVIGIGEANQSGGDPWAQVSDVMVSNNYTVGYYNFFKATYADPYYVSTSGVNTLYYNNLWVGVMTTQMPALDVKPIEGQNGNNLTLNHNTIVATTGTQRFGIWQQAFSNFTGPSIFNITNNNIAWGNHGWECDGGGLACLTNNEDKNMMVLNVPSPGQAVSVHFPNSLSIADYATAAMVDITACNAGASIQACALTPASPGYQNGTDGKDRGADMGQIIAHLSPSDGGGGVPVRVNGRVKLSGRTTIK